MTENKMKENDNEIVLLVIIKSQYTVVTTDYTVHYTLSLALSLCLLFE